MSRSRAIVVFVTLIPAVAFAGPSVTPEDIIKHFSAAPASAQPGEAKTRSVVRPGQPSGDVRSVFIGAAGFGPEPGEQDVQAANAGSVAPPTETTAAPANDPGAYDLLIEFDLNSAALRPEARNHLDAFVEALHSPALSGYQFAIEGHTDSTGPAAYNLELSRKRAAAVVDYLLERGIDPDRLEPRGFGETRPRTSDPRDAANRRVETRLAR